MSKAIYIATTGANSGKSLVSIGLMHTLLWNTSSVGYYRPIIDDTIGDQKDNHLHTMLSHFELNLEYQDAYAFTKSQVLDLLNNGLEAELIAKIIEKFKALESRYDFIIVEGSDFSGVATIIESDVNIMIAHNLGLPVIIVANAADKIIPEFITNLIMSYESFTQKGVEVALLVANKISPTAIDQVQSVLADSIKEEVLLSTIPLSPILNNPSIKEIIENLDGEILFGEDYIHNPVGSFTVGAMQLDHYLPHLESDGLVITPGDRSDIILGALQANLSENYPNVSGILLTGGLLPAPSINRLIDGLSTMVPIVSVEEGTYMVANKVGSVQPQIYATHIDKINLSIDLFEKYIAEELLINKLISFVPTGITPQMFQYNLRQRAKSDKKHIVLPEGTEPRILKATKELIDKEIVDITLIGDRKAIIRQLSALDIDLDIEKIFIINPSESIYFDDYVDRLYQLRKHKGITKAIARDLMQDVSYYGTMMVHQGHADGMVSGSVHSTLHTIRPALQFIKTVPGVHVASSIFFMCLDDRVTLYGDCAINANPNATELAEIAISSAETSMAFGIEPKIAMLSYSSGTSGKGGDVDAVREATEIVKTRRPDLIVEGPIQYDAAVDPGVRKIKLPDSKIAGEANVFIFPDLNSGNNTYKAVQRETGSLAIGPILQGLNKPINDLSRGCTVEDIVNKFIVTAIKAQENNQTL